MDPNQQFPGILYSTVLKISEAWQKPWHHNAAGMTSHPLTRYDEAGLKVKQKQISFRILCKHSICRVSDIEAQLLPVVSLSIFLVFLLSSLLLFFFFFFFLVFFYFFFLNFLHPGAYFFFQFSENFPRFMGRFRVFFFFPRYCCYLFSIC